MNLVKYFHLMYSLNSVSGQFTELEVKAKNAGGCDVLLCCSMVFTPGGAPSAEFFGVDGRKTKDNNPVPVGPQEQFFAWLMLGRKLSRDVRLTPQQRHLCANAEQVIQAQTDETLKRTPS